MIHCSSCQHEIPDGSRFCGYCGAPIPTQEASDEFVASTREPCPSILETLPLKPENRDEDAPPHPITIALDALIQNSDTAFSKDLTIAPSRNDDEIEALEKRLEQLKKARTQREVEERREIVTPLTYETPTNVSETFGLDDAYVPQITQTPNPIEIGDDANAFQSESPYMASLTNPPSIKSKAERTLDVLTNPNFDPTHTIDFDRSPLLIMGGDDDSSHDENRFFDDRTPRSSVTCPKVDKRRKWTTCTLLIVAIVVMGLIAFGIVAFSNIL